MPIRFTGRKPLQLIYDHLNRLFEKVSPWLERHPATQEDILESIRPEALVPPLKPPSRLLHLMRGGVSQTYLKNVFEFLVELSLFKSEESRRAIIFQAGLDKNLTSQIDLKGSGRDFLLLLLNLLSSFGKLESGQDALVAFLNAVESNVGEDKKIIIDGFIEQREGRN